MYVPEHFHENRTEVLHQFIREHPFGTLVVHGQNGLNANHVPFELDAGAGECGVLRAHVARGNPVWREVRDGDQVLVIFQAADAYISPNWYPSKHEFHRQVPTWNYQVVHAHGRIHIRDDEKFVRGVVARLTREHEARSQQTKPWKITDSEASYIDELLKVIVGIEIDVTRLVGKFKLSQNKDARDRAGAATALYDRDAREIAQAMQETLQDNPERS